MSAIDNVSNLLGLNQQTAAPFGPNSHGEWNLVRGVFTNAKGNSLVFFIESGKNELMEIDSATGIPKRTSSTDIRTALDQTSDSGGRRLAIYEYPYRDGQRILDLGRKGQSFQFNIKFFGSNYQTKLADFVKDVVNVPGTGTLSHPTLSPIIGSIQVRFKEYEFVHRYDEYSAVTIKATFIEDSNSTFANTISAQDLSVDTTLQSTTGDLFSKIAKIQQGLTDAVTLLNLPNKTLSALTSKLFVVQVQLSNALGKLAASFSSDATLLGLASRAATVAGGIAGLTSGTVATSNNGGKTKLQQLPPIYQSGFDPKTQASIAAQISSFVNANQITPQQAVFQANQARQGISQAIAQVESQLGTYGYDVILNYRSLAISIQTATEVAVSTAQSKIKLFTVDRDMSLRMVASRNGLSPDRQNDIEALNPYLPSVNFVPKGTVLSVPAS